MTYPSMPQYGRAYQQQYEDKSYSNYQDKQHPNQPSDHNTYQHQYSSATYQRPVQPLQHESWSAPPPPYIAQDPSSVYPPPPPPRPTPQPGYAAQLNAPTSHGQYDAQSPSLAGRPISPLPTSESEYRNRLEAAGVSQQQIAMILGQQGASQNSTLNSSTNPLTAPLQNLSLSDSASISKTSSQPYPFNLPRSAPIVLHDINISDDDEDFCIVPPNKSCDSRLYTCQWISIPGKVRQGIRLQHHKDQNTTYTRTAGSCTYSVQGINFQFNWLNWSDWYLQPGGLRTQHFTSDTGVLPDKAMYWEKDVKNYHGKPVIFMLRCKVACVGLNDEEKPMPDDRVVVTVEVRNDNDADIITFAPGLIEKQDQLDEMLMIALAVKQKFHWDMVMWFAETHKINCDDLSKFDDLSMVPDNVDGWGGETMASVTNAVGGNPAEAKAAKKARWKERAKLFGSSAKLAHQVGQLGMNIAAMNGGQ